MDEDALLACCVVWNRARPTPSVKVGDSDTEWRRCRGDGWEWEHIMKIENKRFPNATRVCTLKCFVSNRSISRRAHWQSSRARWIVLVTRPTRTSACAWPQFPVFKYAYASEFLPAVPLRWDNLPSVMQSQATKPMMVTGKRVVSHKRDLPQLAC